MNHRGGHSGLGEVMELCSSFDANKSTKGASKLRRDLINGEIANLRDLLPLPSSTRQRLSQLQLMALVCVYVRKANYFQQVFKRYHELGHPYSTPNIGFSKALSGFLIMMTQNGKLLYISDNAAEYLGHSMEDLLIHGDSVYDIIDKADHGTVQAELLRSSNTQNPPGEDSRLFLCRMNVSRNARRQMRFGDQKVVLLQGHFLSYLPLCSRNEPVFVATCTPVAMPETRECVVQGATNVFTSIHCMAMKYMTIDRNGEYYLGYTRSELGGISWYQLIHWNYMREAQSKHRLISQSEQEKSCILLLRLQTRAGDWIWVHCVLQVKDGSDSQQQQQSVIVATNQILSEREAAVMRANAWLYHYYTVQTKLQYGLAYPEATGPGAAGSPSQTAARLAAAAYFPTPQLMNYGSHSHHLHPHHHHLNPHHHHHQMSSPESSSPGSYTMPPPLHSPHNGAYTASHPYHHHHAAAFEQMSGKESPLDFSHTATPSSVFEFPGGGYASPAASAAASYWTHHHPHNWSLLPPSAGGGPGATINPPPSNSTLNSSSSSSSYLIGGHNNHHHQQSQQQQQQQQTHHHNSSSSHHTTHHSPSSSSSSNNTNINGNNSSTSTPTSVTNLSPNHTSPNNSSSNSHNNNNSGVGMTSTGHSRNKRLKKSHDLVRDNSSSPPLNTSTNDPSSRATVGFSLQGSGSHGGGSQNVHGSRPHPHHLTHNNNNNNTNHHSHAEVVTMAPAFPYHARHRSVYKILGSTTIVEDDHVSIKEESMTMACPLTPSPIWEGQTQRVPDLQQFYHGVGNGGGGGGGGNSNGGGGVIAGGTDLIQSVHCVPTYQPYLPFCPPNPPGSLLSSSSSSGLMSIGSGGGNNNLNLMALGVNGHSHGLSSTNNTHGLMQQMVESGSPNKENRLPPTPESEHGENEESRVIKWESL